MYRRAMSLRRLVSVLSVCVVASTSLALAGPKQDAPKKDAAPPATPAAAGAGSAQTGSAAQAQEEAAPADMNGTDENPDAPHVQDETKVTANAPASPKRTGYPDEEALRPITMPQNMSEVSIDPHAAVSPYVGTAALRARYGVTSKVQLGLTYVTSGIFDDPATTADDVGFHPGKTVGLDVTVMVQPWLGVRAGVPLYLNPLAFSLALGAPIKFSFGDKYAIGGLDDLLNIKLDRFAPRFDREAANAVAASQTCDKCNQTEQSRGHIRISAYGIMQYQPNVALVGRFGVDNDLGLSGGNVAGTTMNGGGSATFLRAGVDWTPRHWADLGLSIGFDDLAHGGSFSPALYAALRI
jgi:hypothetical protein